MIIYFIGFGFRFLPINAFHCRSHGSLSLVVAAVNMTRYMLTTIDFHLSAPTATTCGISFLYDQDFQIKRRMRASIERIPGSRGIYMEFQKKSSTPPVLAIYHWDEFVCRSTKMETAALASDISLRVFYLIFDFISFFFSFLIVLFAPLTAITLI